MKAIASTEQLKIADARNSCGCVACVVCRGGVVSGWHSLIVIYVFIHCTFMLFVAFVLFV